MTPRVEGGKRPSRSQDAPTPRGSLAAQVEKLRRANSKLRRKYRDLGIAANEAAEQMERLQLELQALRAAVADPQRQHPAPSPTKKRPSKRKKTDAASLS